MQKSKEYAGLSPPDSTAYVAHALRAVQRWVVGAPAYFENRGIPQDPGDLREHVCLAQIRPDAGVRPWRFVRGARQVVVEPRGTLRATAPLAIVELARAGAGLALLPDWLVGDDLESGRLRRVLAGWETPSLATWLIHRAELRRVARVRALVEAMK